MRKLFLSLLVLVAAVPASAQLAVADAPNLAQNVKNFAELQKQVGYLKEQKGQLDETLDLMRKVNAAISDCETARSIIRRQGDLSARCISLVTERELSPSTLQTLTNSIDMIMLNNTRLIRMSRTILSTNVKMNDAERLTKLQEIEKQTIDQERKVSKVSQIITQYERMKRALR